MAEAKTKVTAKPAEPTKKFVDVELASKASTTLYIGKHAVEFVDGKAAVTNEVAALLKEKKFV